MGLKWNNPEKTLLYMEMSMGTSWTSSISGVFHCDVCLPQGKHFHLGVLEWVIWCCREFGIATLTLKSPKSPCGNRERESHPKQIFYHFVSSHAQAICILVHWLVVSNMTGWFSISYIWECHNPNWRSHMFQRGRSTTNQRSIWSSGESKANYAEAVKVKASVMVDGCH